MTNLNKQIKNNSFIAICSIKSKSLTNLQCGVVSRVGNLNYLGPVAPQLSKNWKPGFSRSSLAGLTSKNSFTSIELENSSIENGMLQSHAQNN